MTPYHHLYDAAHDPGVGLLATFRKFSIKVITGTEIRGPLPQNRQTRGPLEEPPAAEERLPPEGCFRMSQTRSCAWPCVNFKQPERRLEATLGPVPKKEE